MPVISVSLSNENLEFLDKIQDIYKLKGRSDAVRTSIHSAISEMQDMENMSGNVEGILITVRHDHADRGWALSRPNTSTVSRLRYTPISGTRSVWRSWSFPAMQMS